MVEILCQDVPMGLAGWVSNEQVFYFCDILYLPATITHVQFLEPNPALRCVFASPIGFLESCRHFS